jgi:hypothetical protein
MDIPALPPELPPREKLSLLQVLLHIGITYGLSLVCGFIIGMITAMAHQPLPAIAIAITNVVSSVVGFAIAGYRAKGPLWPHLLLVALGLWLTGLPNVALGFPFTYWLLSSIVILIGMAVGGGVGALLKKKKTDEAPLTRPPA